jgi:hypothetical protein
MPILLNFLRMLSIFFDLVFLYSAYVFSIILFALFIHLVLSRPTQPPTQALARAGEDQLQSGLDLIPESIEALAKLTDSFTKASPLVITIISCMLFLVIGLTGAGILIALLK